MAGQGRKSTSGMLRIPGVFGDIQVNSCRNPACSNFGNPAMPFIRRGRPSSGAAASRDDYVLSGDSRVAPDSFLKCKRCLRTLSIKSNAAIAAELSRISAYLEPRPEPSCRTPDCANAGVGVYSRPEAYAAHGGRGGAQRFRCKACRKTFSVERKATARQKAPHLNRTVFAEVVSKKPLRGIMEVTGLSASAVYDKLDFLYRQCRGFAGERERRAHRVERKRVQLCVDRQDYMINWRAKSARKNIQLTAICTVEVDSQYVLGHHLNFDPDINQTEVEDAAALNGDFAPGTRSYFRAQPQYWLNAEFARLAGTSKTDIRPDFDGEEMTVDELIAVKSRWESILPDPERPDLPGRGNQLSPDGVMTYLDYTAYAHARLVRRFVSGARYVTIYSDQDEVLRAAFISAFAPKILMEEAEMAYVQFQKQMTIDEKKDLMRKSSKVVASLAQASGETEQAAIVKFMADEYAAAASSKPDWRKRWIPHPRSTINEPKRRVLYLTDTGNKTPEHIGWTLAGATLAPVDNYFMRLRRKINYLERPIPTRSNASRLWSGYHAYDPKRVLQMLEIFRTYTNYIRTKDGKSTPAMKFGLAKGPVRFEDIIYWMPKVPTYPI